MFYTFFLFTSIFVIASAQIWLPEGSNIWTAFNDIFQLNDILPTFPDVTDDIFLTTPDLIRKEGYPVEEHSVETEDGYLLGVHRIPGSPSASDAHKATVLVLHGYLSSSADWVIAGKEKSLGYLLADQNFDVWLGNMRGNVYSRNHTTLSPCEPQFWDFSWHENGIYDIPAMLGYITKYKKENTSLFVVGYSLSTTAFYVTASLRPEAVTTVQAMYSLGPIAFLNHLTGSFRLLIRFIHEVKLFFHVFFHGEVLRLTPLSQLVFTFLCDGSRLTERFCTDIIFSAYGFDREQLNYTLVPKIFGHYPAGGSFKSFDHYAQLVKSGEFRQYDYGLLRNLEVYGNILPPDYDISKMMVPISLIHGDNDPVANPVDTERLYQLLPIKLEKYRVQDPKFTHVDFLWATNANDLVYKKLISMMKDHLS